MLFRCWFQRLRRRGGDGGRRRRRLSRRRFNRDSCSLCTYSCIIFTKAVYSTRIWSCLRYTLYMLESVLHTYTVFCVYIPTFIYNSTQTVEHQIFHRVETEFIRSFTTFFFSLLLMRFGTIYVYLNSHSVLFWPFATFSFDLISIF